MIRTFDAKFVNGIVNHPEVRPFVGGDGESFIDLASVLADGKNICLMDEHGGFMATWTAPDTYELHTFILPAGRGRKAYANARELLSTLKANFGALHIWTRVPHDQENVRRFTIASGLKPCGEQICDFGGGPARYDLFHWRSSCLSPEQ